MKPVVGMKEHQATETTLGNPDVANKKIGTKPKQGRYIIR